MSAPKRHAIAASNPTTPSSHHRGGSSSRGGARGGRGGGGGTRPNAFLGVRITSPSIVAGVRACQAALAIQQPSLAGGFNDPNTLHVTCGLARIMPSDHKKAKLAIEKVIPAIQASVATALGLPQPTASEMISASLPFAGVGYFNGGRLIFGQPSVAPGVGGWMPATVAGESKAVTQDNKNATRTLLATVASAIDAHLVASGIEMIHEAGRTPGSNYVHDPIDDKEDAKLADMSRKFHMTIAKSSSGGGRSARPAPTPAGASVGQPGEWQCVTCNDGNWLFASKTSCRKCGALRPASATAAGIAAASSSGGGGGGRPGEWQCSTCNDGNWIFASKAACRKCGALKPTTSTTAPATTTTTTATAASSSGGRPGDWQCVTCNDGHWIFASKSACRKCGAAKPAAAAAVAATPVTIVTITPSSSSAAATATSAGRPGDWQCATCNDGHWLFASKTMCRKCFTPKPETATSTTTTSAKASPAAPTAATAPTASSSSGGIDWSVIHPLLNGSEPLHCIELLEMSGSAKRSDGYYGQIARIPLFPHLNAHCSICCGN